MSTRIYIVTDAETTKHRLIRSATPAAAIRYAVRTRYSAEVASQDDLVRLLGKGAVVEAVNTEDEPAEAILPFNTMPPIAA